ncbi:MAG: hypothetical protein AAGI88_23565 [Pseudomonadota bacterium]
MGSIKSIWMLGVALATVSLAFAHDKDAEVIRWLNWPVTAYPFEGLDVGGLIPPPESRFSLETERDIRIGLRADGVVVWEFIDDSTQTESNQLMELKFERAH